MKVHISLLLLFFLKINLLYCQTKIIMKEENGIYTMPCKVNGLPLRLIFDTGASNVSISITEANFMIKNKFIKKDEIKGTQYFQIASGEVKEGTEIILKEIEIGDIILKDVHASVVHELDAPLLLGQSALSKFNKILFDYSNNTLTLFQNDFEFNTQKHKLKFEESIDKILLEKDIYNFTNNDIQIISIRTKLLPDKSRVIEELTIRNNTEFDLKYFEIKSTMYDKVLRYIKDNYLLHDELFVKKSDKTLKLSNQELLVPNGNTLVLEISDWDIK